MFNMPIDREYCELKSWSSLQDSLLEQIASSKRDASKKKLRGQMEIFSIPEYLKKVYEIDTEHEKRLKQNKKWQVLQKKKPAVHINISDDTENRITKNVLTEKIKLNTGLEKKCIAKEHVSKSLDKKIAAKFKKNVINPQNQHFQIATPTKNIHSSPSNNGFLITKLSSSTTLIKKLPTTEKTLSKLQLSFPEPTTLPASSTLSVSPIASRNKKEISSEIPHLGRLNNSSEITPGTSETVMNSSPVSLSEVPQSYSKLSFNAWKTSKPIRQYGSSSKNSRKSVESAPSQWSIENITLSMNSSVTSTEKAEFCSSETMMTETFSPLLTIPSFHNEWTEPEIYYTPKLIDVTKSYDCSSPDLLNPFHSIQLDEPTTYFSSHFTASPLSFGEL
ncbi:unnamed protein product [Nezara viridula]|uniref:Uncharacterized protein n=1 Tax=Nezara viridula TaxID=85310 RepID=A0A9P0MRL0_NEZVI|nr:unnamed protein product [Nezara viridula]